MATLVHGAAPGVAAAQDRAPGNPAEDPTAAAHRDTAMAYAKQTDPAAGLSFETSAHRAWYGVFWTGECAELSFLERMFCMKGEPTWTEITRMAVAKARPDTQAVIRHKMNTLGRTIGYEWARPNDERRIDSEDLERWSEWLKDSPNVNGVLDRLDKAARSLIEEQQ